MSRRLTVLGCVLGLACGGGDGGEMDTGSGSESSTEGGGAPSIEPGDIIISEFLSAPFNSADDLTPQLYVEFHNTTDEPIDLQGLEWGAGFSAFPTINVSVVVPPNGYSLIGGSTDPELNRGIPIEWYWGLGGQLAEQGGDLQLRRTDGTVIDRVVWSFPEWPFDRGLAWSLDSGSLDHLSNDGVENWCQVETWYLPADLEWSPGEPNPPCP
jgi:hypothetical protein